MGNIDISDVEIGKIDLKGDLSKLTPEQMERALLGIRTSKDGDELIDRSYAYIKAVCFLSGEGVPLRAFQLKNHQAFNTFFGTSSVESVLSKVAAKYPQYGFLIRGAAGNKTIYVDVSDLTERLGWKHQVNEIKRVGNLRIAKALHVDGESKARVKAFSEELKQVVEKVKSEQKLDSRQVSKIVEETWKIVEGDQKFDDSIWD
jgi:hypothetical protein